MRLSLPSSISSRQDLKAVVMELQAYAHWSSQNAVKQRVVNQPFEGQPGLSPAAAELLRQAGAGPDSQNLDRLIGALEAFAAKAPYVTITLAAPAPNSLKQAIVTWFRQNVRPDILVDFNFSAPMLGGMSVRYGSHVFDGSFKRKIMANRNKFPEVLRHV